MIKIGNDWYRCAGPLGLQVERKVGSKWLKTSLSAGNLATEWRHQVDDEFKRRGVTKPAAKVKDIINDGHNKLAGWKTLTPVQFVDRCEHENSLSGVYC